MSAIDTLSFAEPDSQQGVDLAHVDMFSIGPIVAKPFELTLSTAEQSIRIEPKVMKVFVALAIEPGRVLSRDDLTQLAWGGRIVGDASINRVVCILRTTLENLANDKVGLETLPRVGYRLILDYKMEAKRGRQNPPDSGKAFPRWALAIPLLVAALLVFAFWPRAETINSIHIVMLPLEAEAPEDHFLALGLETQLRDQLAASSELEITSSDSAVQLLGEGYSPQQIARALDADFVISGRFVSVEPSYSLKLTVYSSGGESPIWVRELVNQDDQGQLILGRAAREIRQVVGLNPGQSGVQFSLPSEDYFDFILARGIVRSQRRESMPIAEQILERLLGKHEDFVPGLIALAIAQQYLPYPAGGDPEELSRRWQRTGDLLDRALELDPQNAQALGLRGFYSDGDPQERLDLLNRSLELDAGNTRIMQMHAILSLATGQAEQALASYDRIIDLDPLWLRAPQGYDMAIELGQRDQAEQMMARLRAIVSDLNQILLLEAAEARALGDLSRAYELLSSLDENATDGQQLTARFYLTGIELQLGLIEEMNTARPNLREVDRLLLVGRLPGKNRLEALGMTTRMFWGDQFFREYAPRILVASEQSADLVSYYDEFAGSPERLLEKISNGSFDYRSVAPYLALALAQVGRAQDADAVLRIAEEIDQAFTSHGQQNMAELFRSAQLYAVLGRNDEALANLEQARAMGWPYNSAWLLSEPYTFTLSEDPAFVHLRGDPRFQRLSDEVEAERQRERRQVLALRTN